MFQSKKIRLRTTLFSGMVLGLIFQGGCAKAPSDLLVGRWYSGEMTIRFREDSAVIWNSTRGLAKGRYEFTGKIRRIRTEEAKPNLYLDIIRNDEREQMQMEISFIGQDRLRLEIIPFGEAPPSDGIPTGIVMKRANDSLLGGKPVQVAQR